MRRRAKCSVLPACTRFQARMLENTPFRSEETWPWMAASLMQMIIAYARAKGFRRIEGQVLQDNTTMLDI